jgi:hypothetical protein
MQKGQSKDCPFLFYGDANPESQIVSTSQTHSSAL